MSDIDWCDLDNDSLSDLEIDIEDIASDDKEALASPVFKIEEAKMTRFEITSVLIYRSRQLDHGKKPHIVITWEQTSVQIAQSEFEARNIKLRITRQYPNGNQMTFNVDQMDR